MSEEKTYQFNEYVMGYDKGEKDRSSLTISKVLNGNMYVMATLTDESADIISLMLDKLNKELQQKENIIKEIRKCIGQHKRYRHYAVKGEMPISTYESAGLELINKYEIKKILDKETNKMETLNMPKYTAKIKDITMNYCEYIEVLEELETLRRFVIDTYFKETLSEERKNEAREINRKYFLWL